MIKTHGHVSAAKKYVWAHQCVIYATDQVAEIYISSYTVPYIPNLKETFPEIQVPETRSSYFSSHQTIKRCTNYVLVHQFYRNLVHKYSSVT